MPSKISIKELHATTGDWVRKAGRAQAPLIITDRGSPVAVLANPAFLQPHRRVRVLLPEFEAMMRGPGVGNVQEDLDAVRGDR
jgi:prevent-host-death family protein